MIAVGVATALLLAASPASAQPTGDSAVAVAAGPGAHPTPATTTDHYGWTILAIDAGSVAIGIAAGESRLAAASFLGLWFGGAVVHLAHGNGAGALRSVGSRFGFPMVGALGGFLVTYAAISPDHEDESLGPLLGGVVGGLAGFGVALYYDWFRYSARTRPVEAPAGAQFAPTVSATDGGGVIGVAGTF